MEISSSVEIEINNNNVNLDISNVNQNVLTDPTLHFDERFNLTSNLEVCKSLKDKFLKSFQFSPDGTSALTTSEDNYFQIYEIDKSIIEEKKYYKQNLLSSFSSNSSNSSNYLYSKNKIMAGESIFDSKWYPFANSNDPISFCFVSTCRSHPIQLWDAHTGKVRCSYRGHNHLDELDVANSVSFNLNGSRIFAGSKNMIRFYDVANPGCNYTDIPTCTSKKDYTGQKGIISCLAFNPDYSGAFAAGSYSNCVGIYVEDMKGCALQINDLECGVTHMKWSPNGCNLWIGGRGSDSIVCWDVRNTREEIGRVNRSLNSNQRLSFDLDPWGKYLITGSQDGKLLVYDSTTFELVSSKDNDGYDCINSCSFHPFCGIIGVSTGQRHFSDEYNNNDDDDDDDNVQSNSPVDYSNKIIIEEQILEIEKEGCENINNLIEINSTINDNNEELNRVKKRRKNLEHPIKQYDMSCVQLFSVGFEPIVINI